MRPRLDRAAQAVDLVLYLVSLLLGLQERLGWSVVRTVLCGGLMVASNIDLGVAFDLPKILVTHLPLGKDGRKYKIFESNTQ